MKYIDAHCHLQFDAYNEDREQIIQEMKERGVYAIVVGVDFESSKKAVALAEQHENMYATVGLHPCYVTKENFNVAAYKEIATHPKVVAIGECGLDFFREEDIAVHEQQREVFQKQVELSLELQKPLMIHSRPRKGAQDAYHEVIKVLEPHSGLVSGNIHFFVGGDVERDAFERLNFTVSVTGVITFTDDYNSMVTGAKHSMLLGETDSPYVAPEPHRGERNSALNVVFVYKKIAELWGVSEDTARKHLIENTRRVFRL